MTFSKLLAALAGTLLLNPLAQVHGAKEYIMPPYVISTSNQGDDVEITFESVGQSFLASEEDNLRTTFQCQNGSSDEHYVGTTVSNKQTMNILMRNDTIVVGSIVDEVDGNVYQFSTNGSGDLQTIVTHTSNFPKELDPFEDDDSIPSRHLRNKDSNNVQERVLSSNCPVHVIDVLVPWTAQAECKAAGQSSGCNRDGATAKSIKDLIQLAVAETNTAYENSGVRVNGQVPRLNLAHAYYEPSITESLGFGGILGQTQRSQEIATQRTNYGADIVASVTSLDQFCGIAYMGPNIINMFSVTSTNCATGYFSFGHEIGHNMGCNHDRGTSNQCSTTNYNYGYRDPDAGFRSILAYNCRTNQCDYNKGGGSCTRVQRFSNDEFLYNGKAIGNSEADNARQHSDVFATVSTYYDCKGSSPTAQPTQSPTKLCVDDLNFTKSRGERERTCEYIGQGNKQWRLNKWCNKKKHGRPISEACCETCKKCTCGAGCGKPTCD